MQVAIDPGTQFSDSLGCVVKNRRDFREILRRSQDTERPINSYEPIKRRKDRAPRWNSGKAANGVIHERPIDADPRERVKHTERVLRDLRQ